MKEKVVLHREMETLLIPLYGRAEMTRLGKCADKVAVETLKAIEYDFDRLKIPKKMQVFMALRCNILDDFARDYLVRNPGATVLSLGSGLDARCARVTGYGRWVDLDFPEVVALREKLLPVRDAHENIASSVTDWAWLDRVPETRGKVLVIAEGLLMYLREEDVHGLFNRIRERFEDVTYAFDAYSEATVKRSGSIPSLKKTGAVIRWGIDDPRALERPCGLKYLNSIYFTDPRYVGALDPLYRLTFRVAARFRAAREAHRLLVYSSRREA